jgi:hypothetical protein
MELQGGGGRERGRGCSQTDDALSNDSLPSPLQLPSSKMDDADNDNLIRRFAISKVFIFICAVCTLANNFWIASPPPPKIGQMKLKSYTWKMKTIENN